MKVASLRQYDLGVRPRMAVREVRREGDESPRLFAVGPLLEHPVLLLRPPPADQSGLDVGEEFLGDVMNLDHQLAEHHDPRAAGGACAPSVVVRAAGNRVQGHSVRLEVFEEIAVVVEDDLPRLRLRRTDELPLETSGPQVGQQIRMELVEVHVIGRDD